VHDGECTDKTLEIAKRYTSKIFIKNHVGDSSVHRVFTYEQAQGEWIFQIDGDEYLDITDHELLRKKIVEAGQNNVNSFALKWEMWNGEKALYVKGYEKVCLFRKKNYHYLNVTHAISSVDGKTERLDIFLHHRPAYNNIAWKSFFIKAKRWIPVHTKFFFPQLVVYECFNTTPDAWVAYTNRVRKHPLLFLIFVPFKMSLGQFKNGLYQSLVGWQSSLQQYVYYFCLYWKVWRLQRSLNVKQSKFIK
jgi:glycosyltransferase involved in cell wall biosynthesis